MSLTQKLINDGNDAVDEMLRGILAARPMRHARWWLKTGRVREKSVW